MNILYISNLSTNIAAGLNWSVPASIAAQAKIDNVLWVNLTNVVMEHWTQVTAFHNVREFGTLELGNLPSPFDKPDVVVFEGFYHPKDPLFAKKLKKANIPYIVIPRSSLTYQAQHDNWKKRLKKRFGNYLLFRPYTKSALAIQYLTPAEARDSGTGWNDKCIIVPNGFYSPIIRKSNFTVKGINAVFIGRLDLYQKGLDVLLQACLEEHEFLSSNQFKLTIYGPERYDFKQIDDFVNNHNLKDIIERKHEIGGQDKEKVLLEADLFLLPSRFEGHPMGLIEALAYGIPSLVTPGSNMSDEIKNTDSGWVADCTVASIGQALRNVIEEKSLLPQKSKNAIELSKVYDWNAIAQDFHDKVETLLRDKSKNKSKRQ